MVTRSNDCSLKRLLERIQHAKEKDVQHNGDCAAGFPAWFAAHGLLAGPAGRTGVGITATCRNRQVVSRSLYLLEKLVKMAVQSGANAAILLLCRGTCG